MLLSLTVREFNALTPRAQLSKTKRKGVTTDMKPLDVLNTFSSKVAYLLKI